MLSYLCAIDGGAFSLSLATAMWVSGLVAISCHTAFRVSVMSLFSEFVATTESSRIPLLHIFFVIPLGNFISILPEEHVLSPGFAVRVSWITRPLSRLVLGLLSLRHISILFRLQERGVVLFGTGLFGL